MRFLHSAKNLGASAAIGCALACSGSTASSEVASDHPGWAYYTQYCAMCHGPNMEGGMSGSLRDGQWQYGGSREQIFASIRDGIPDAGMPAYGNALTAGQVNLIVDVITGGEEEAAPEPTPEPEPEEYDIIETLDYDIRVETWVEGLSTPWDIVFLDAETALVTEISGPVRLIRNGELHPEPIRDTPEAVAAGQGGMLAVAKDPGYEENGWIYLAYSHGIQRGARTVSNTRVVRGRIDDHRWLDEEVVFEAPERTYSPARQHFGTRIVFDEEGHLYFSIGDRGSQADAQRLDHSSGKVHRLHRDGSIPEDNPFLDVEGALPSIYTYGHRNQQGLDFHPLTGELWSAEHGPRGGDEINIVRAGNNYGWPEVTYGINYSGTVITRERYRPGIEPPVWVWRPSTAVCAIEFYRGDQFPFWRNHLLATALRNQDLRLLQVRHDRVIHEEVILRDRGRIRDVATGPDGAVYLLMNSPDEILRLSFVEEVMR